MRRYRLLVTAPLALGLALSPGELAAQADPDRAVAGGGAFPVGWHVQTDYSPRTNTFPTLENVKFTAMGDGYHATMGPRAIFWRDADTVSGSYHVVVSITQTKNPEHPEAYGLIIGGRHLADSTQAYTYFLVRGYDGQFSIWRRPSQKAARSTPVVGWTAHPAVTKADSATGKATNELSVLVQGGKVSFMVNGKEVHAANAGDVDTAGIVGYRVNHDLDVHLGPIGIHRIR